MSLIPQSPQDHKDDLSMVALKNQSGLEVELLNLGAGIRSIRMPTKRGPVNAVLSYPRTTQHHEDNFYLGSTLGRNANRLGDAQFELNGQVYELAKSPGQGGHSLHGGPCGFSHQYWTTKAGGNDQSVTFNLESPDGDQGFPGKLEAVVRYSIMEEWKLLIDFEARADADTVINLANHAYFNLNNDDTSANDHLLHINADHYTPLDANMIPTGDIATVADTIFDFRQPAHIDERLDAGSGQLETTGGFDHNFIVNGPSGQLRHAASLRSPGTGLRLNVYTTQPALQFYGGQFLSNPFRPGLGICLEAQGMPNAPNTPGFPSTVVRAGELYRQQTMYELLQE